MNRSECNLSYEKLLSCPIGMLIPVGLKEVLPGDMWRAGTSILARFSALVAPVMHRMDLFCYHFFVPHRLVWEDFEDFITGGDDGTSVPVRPYFNLTNTVPLVGNTADYYGIPQLRAWGPQAFSAIPLRGYYRIWDQFFRDTHLQSEPALADNVASGEDTDAASAALAVPLKVNWQKDYLTTARLTPQLGPDVVIPVNDTAIDVTRKNNATAMKLKLSGSNTDATDGAVSTSSGFLSRSGQGNMALDPQGQLEVALAGLGITPADMRAGLASQRYTEAMLRTGSRYTEWLRRLGVRSADSRLQRPEYLGGGKVAMQISEVLQTGLSVDAADDPLGAVGNLAGHGIGGLRSNRFRRFFSEHGYVHSFVCIRPKNVYAEGAERHWFKDAKEDFWTKELEFIGQQPVHVREVQLGNEDASDTVFGYQDRYAEYKSSMSDVAGKFRTDLKYWGFWRLFENNNVNLNSTFIQCNPRYDAFAIQDDAFEQVYIKASHKIRASRLVTANAKPRTF